MHVYALTRAHLMVVHVQGFKRRQLLAVHNLSIRFARLVQRIYYRQHGFPPILTSYLLVVQFPALSIKRVKPKRVLEPFFYLLSKMATPMPAVTLDKLKFLYIFVRAEMGIQFTLGFPGILLLQFFTQCIFVCVCVCITASEKKLNTEVPCFTTAP